jgi:AraC-like DNA-binding protein
MPILISSSPKIPAVTIAIRQHTFSPAGGTPQVAGRFRYDGVVARQIVQIRCGRSRAGHRLQPHNYTEALTESEGLASVAVAKRAIDLMHAHPEKPWSTADLARATGASARTLQRSFERSDLPSPMMYLRRLRLHRVHTELAVSSPDSVTVTMVGPRSSSAARHGDLPTTLAMTEKLREEVGFVAVEAPTRYATVPTGTAQLPPNNTVRE